MADFNRRNPEDLLSFFPTDDPWTKSMGNTNTAQTLAKQDAPFKIFVKLFFLLLPEQQEEDKDNYKYPDPLPDPPPLDKTQLERVIWRLPPYKAPSLDGIPNIVIQKCLDIIADFLLCIYRAILDLQGIL